MDPGHISAQFFDKKLCDEFARPEGTAKAYHLSILEVPDQPLSAPRPVSRFGFAVGVTVSLVLHALAALLLADGFKGHRPTQAIEAVEVDLVELLEVSPPEPDPAEDATAITEEELRQEEDEAEEDQTPVEAEVDPAPEPTPETQNDILEEDPVEAPIEQLQAVVEFSEEDKAPAGREDEDPEQVDTSVETAEAEDLPAEDAGTPEVEVVAPEQEEPQIEEPEAEEVETAALQPEDEVAEGVTEEPVLAEPEASEQPEELTSEEDPAETEEPAPPSEPADESAADNDLSEEIEAGVSTNELQPENAGESVDEPEPESSNKTAEEPKEGAGTGEIIIAAIPRTKPPAPVRTARQTSRGGGPPPVRRLLSDTVIASDPRMRTAIRGMPPGARLNALCITELEAQLKSQRPPFNPDLMPSLRPRRGTVLEPGGRVGFRSFGNWYDVVFRCKVNRSITKVESFSYEVVGAVPRSQWRTRGFPAN